MPRLLVNLDVPDIELAIAFYANALGLRVGRRLGPTFVELLGAEVPLYLLSKPPGSSPFADARFGRGYDELVAPAPAALAPPT